MLGGFMSQQGRLTKLNFPETCWPENSVKEKSFLCPVSGEGLCWGQVGEEAILGHGFPRYVHDGKKGKGMEAQGICLPLWNAPFIAFLTSFIFPTISDGNQCQDQLNPIYTYQ